jgi:5'-3' exonuclease
VIAAPGAEADDVIGRFIQLHPEDEIVIVSSDTDYYQMISHLVQQYNGITKELITIDGNFGDNGKPIIDKKTMEHKHIGDPAWLLFEKCIRGDKSDNVFSAYPGVRKKGTKNKIGLLEAYADRDKKGYNWNNLMLQRWTDHDGVEHRVLDDYERNKVLIDLTAQPQEVIDSVDTAIVNCVLTDSVTLQPPRDVNFQFMKFCGKHDLVRLSEHPQDIVSWLAKPYRGHILNLTLGDGIHGKN